jgi:hypothetical protein
MSKFQIVMQIGETGVRRRNVTAESDGEAWELAEDWLYQLDDAEIISVKKSLSN